MKKVNSFTFDQVVLINGILGYVDFIGSDITILVDSKNCEHIIQNKDICDVYSKENTTARDMSIFNCN